MKCPQCCDDGEALQGRYIKVTKADPQFGVAPIEKVAMNIKAKTPLNGCLFCIAWDCFQNQSLARVKDSENSIHGVVFKKIVFYD